MLPSFSGHEVLSGTVVLVCSSLCPRFTLPFVPYSLHCRLWTTINLKLPEADVVIFMSLSTPHLSALHKVRALLVLVEFR